MRTRLYIGLVLLCPAMCFGAFHFSQADLNHDGKVNLEDFAMFASAWMWESSCTNAVPAVIGTHYNAIPDTSYWYVFTPGSTAFYKFNLSEALGYTISVYDGCYGGDYWGGRTGDGFFILSLDGGVSYYLQVEKTGSPVGEYDLFIEVAPE